MDVKMEVLEKQNNINICIDFMMGNK